MADGIHSVTTSEWKLVHRRLDDLENLVTDLKLKMETLGECKCNRSNSYLGTQHYDDEETETIIGLNTQSNTSAPSGIIDDTGQSTTQSEETVTLEARDSNSTVGNTVGTSIPSTSSKSSDCTSLSSADNRPPVSTKSTSLCSNGIVTYDLEKYRRAQVKLKRCDQVEVRGSSSSSEFGIANSKSTLTSTDKESLIQSKKSPVLRLRRDGARGSQVSSPTLSHKKRFVCNFCAKRFVGKSDLTLHVRVHTGDKPFQCETCSMEFNRSSTLKMHTRIHTGEKPFECGLCLKTFGRSTSLTRHTRVHTGDKPYECGFCSKRFSESKSLVLHMRAHTGERPYTCQFCSKTFAGPTTLAVHLRVHTREKPYSCPICPKAFAKNLSLKLHLKKHPGETPQP